MRDYKFLIFLFAIFFLVNCSNRDTQSLIDTEAVETREKGEIPKDHELYSANSFGDLFLVYQNSKKNEINKDYFVNIQHIALFRMLEDKNFYQIATKEEKLYLLEEMVDMKNALPNLYHFYKLLSDLYANDLIEVEEAEKIAKHFRDKNLNYLSTNDFEENILEDKKNELQKGETILLNRIRLKEREKRINVSAN